MRYEVVGRSIVEPYAGDRRRRSPPGAPGFEETGLLVGYWAGTLAALAYAIWGRAALLRRASRLRRYRLAPRPRCARSCATARCRRATTVLNGLFARLDLYLVGLFLGESPAGIYGMARQVAHADPPGPAELRRAADPDRRAARSPPAARRRPARATASATRLILAIQLPILVGLAVIGLPLLDWLGPEFAAGYWPCCCSPRPRRSRARSASPT